jgi:hypothetical protein
MMAEGNEIIQENNKDMESTRQEVLIEIANQ